MAGKAPESAQISGTPGKDLLNKDGKVTELIEWATQNSASPEQLLDLFAAEGIAVSHGEEITGDYTVVHGEEKLEWCGKHEGVKMFIVQWHFYGGNIDNETGEKTNEFAAMHVVTPVGKFILNDSAKGGMYGQLVKITDERERKDPESAVMRTSTAGLMVAGGLRRNKPFMFDKRTKRAIKKADLNDTVMHPMEFREQSKPTWSFNF